MAYEIAIRRKAQKTLAKIPEPYQTRIIDAVRKLSDTPYPNSSKKLIGRPAWRLRIGNYRTIYEINDNQLIILVLDIDHKKNIYRP